MFELKEKYRICEMAEYLKVSVSGYYSWLNRPESNKSEDKLIKNEMKIIFDDSRKTYGASRIMVKLREKGFTVGKHRCRRLMKELGLVPVVKSERITADLVVKAFEMAVSAGTFTELFLIFHTDRGSQYCSDKFKKSVKKASEKLGIRIYQSMSSTGNCYDNAAAESFFHTLKVEWVNRFIFINREIAKRATFDYLECFYNRNRIHSSIGYKIPQQMEDEYFKNLRADNVG